MFDLDTKPLALLTTGNPKTAKGEGFGYLTAILHLAPASVSGRNVCPHATEGCRTACLNTAGRGGIGLDSDGLNVIQAARIRRTRYWQRDRGAFMADLVAEIEKHVRSAKRHGLKPAVRLNGTSDLPWERFPVRLHRLPRSHGGVTIDGTWEYPNIMAAFPHVTFYDYTKWPERLRPLVRDIPNYSLTFSLAESNDDHASNALHAGMNVAAVFDTGKSEDLPDVFMIGTAIRPVIDGDKSDLRFLDPTGVIVGLRAKGRAKQDRSGFVRRAN